MIISAYLEVDLHVGPQRQLYQDVISILVIGSSVAGWVVYVLANPCWVKPSRDWYFLIVLLAHTWMNINPKRPSCWLAISCANISKHFQRRAAQIKDLCSLPLLLPFSQVLTCTDICVYTSLPRQNLRTQAVCIKKRKSPHRLPSKF